MRFQILMASIGLFILCFAVEARATDFFVIKFTPGERWIADLGYEHQPKLESHFDYWQSLYLSEVLLMSGPFEDEAGGLFIVRAENLRAAEALMQADPGVKQKMIISAVHPWRILTSAMRSVKPQRTVEIEPDQSFKIERLDPSSPINLPGN